MLQKLLRTEHPRSLGSMKTVNGDYTTNIIKSLELLLEIHFPDIIPPHVQEEKKNFQKMFTNEIVKCTINSFKISNFLEETEFLLYYHKEK